MVSESRKRISRNIMIDKDKDLKLEDLRFLKTGYGTTARQRSDVYNEIISLGIKMNELRLEIGEREFEKFWSFINKIDLKKINLERFI